MSKYIIYALQDPVTFEIRYIGLSSIGLKRVNQHTQPNSLSKDKSHKANWIRSLLKQGLKPAYTIIQMLSNRKDLLECEKYWINYFKDKGVSLTNLTSGGDGTSGYKWKDDDIRRLRPHPMQGKKYTPEERSEISRLTKLGMNNSLVRSKISNSKKGKPAWNKGLSCKS